MTHKYDLRLTLRQVLNPELIFKQYIAKDISFPNPIATGDKLHMANDSTNYAFWSEPVEVYHSPEPVSRSVIYADVKTFNEHLSRIEQLLAQYNPKEF